MNTTAGSFALLGSIVPDDAGVVKRLRKAGAIILGEKLHIILIRAYLNLPR
jgi:amidase